MNARDYKLFSPGCVYHIYNRGDNKEPIFLDEQDYFSFLRRLKILLGLLPVPPYNRRSRITLKPMPIGSFSVFAYCLMPNHFHIMIRQNIDTPVGKLMTGLCTSYAKYFNRKYERLGNLFQDTFKAKLVESDEYAVYLSAYIHNNPENPFGWQYSSLPDYLGLRNGQISDQSLVLGYFKSGRDGYKDFLSQQKDFYANRIKHLIFDE